MIEVTVELGPRRYPVYIGRGLTARLSDVLVPVAGRRTVVVSSRRVWSLHGAKVSKALGRLGRFRHVLIPDGERYKSRDTLDAIHDAFLRAGLARDGLVVAFGGGMVGDVAGFAAATYMRGVDWVPLPTTLLAMVDSSIGGKVGINHPQAKNLIGAFHQPRIVVADTRFLETLPLRTLRSGAYEVLKCGLIADRALFDALGKAPLGLEGWDPGAQESAIASACRLKAVVVAQDEREGGLRRVLNLGHTLGHALESATQYRRFTHGEAVGWGLVGAAAIARGRGLLAESPFEAIVSAVDHLGNRPRISDLPPHRILGAVSRDKKVSDGRAVFILPTDVGRVIVATDVEAGEIRQALRVMAGRETRA